MLHATPCPQTPTFARTYASVPVKVGIENTIRLRVRANQLQEVAFNGEVVRGVSDAPLQSPAAGPFGVFNRTSDGVVSNPLFNNQPLPLLTEAGPRVSENP